MVREFRTDRLLLRQWKDEDRQPMAAINNDPKVMQYFPRSFTNSETNLFVDENISRIAAKGWGAWAVEIIESREFIGFVGFSRPADWHPCAGSIDIGWRLKKDSWGNGFATEAAIKALQTGFERYNFSDVVSFTSRCNLPSISVMRKIGLQKDSESFEHPRIDCGSRLRTHVVYRVSQPQWQQMS